MLVKGGVLMDNCQFSTLQYLYETAATLLVFVLTQLKKVFADAETASEFSIGTPMGNANFYDFVPGSDDDAKHKNHNSFIKSNP